MATRTRTPLALAALLVALLGLSLAADASQAASLRYFGYFASRLTQAEGDHLSEVAGRSNLDWVQISDPDKYRPEVLDGCAPGGCIISTGNEFFRNCTGVHNPECELYPNYVERWSKLAEAVRSRIDKVGAFYLMDEAQYRGATRAELETAAATIKASYPTIPVMTIEAGPQVTSAYQVPANVDWVGFDWYCQPFKTIEEKLAILTGKIGPAQSLYMVPESAPLTACGGAAGHATDADIAKLQYQYYNLALSNPRVIGLLAFGFWTSGYGSAQLPLTVAAHQAIFNAIAAANQPPPPPPPPPPAPAPAPAPAHPDRAARIHGSEAKLDGKGFLELPLGCPAANASTCTGSLTFRQLGKAAAKAPPLGRRNFTIRPGHAKQVPVRLEHGKARVQRLLRHGHELWLKAIVNTAAGKTATKVRVRRGGIAARTNA